MQLPEDDERYLADKGCVWELCPDGEGACLIVRDYEVSSDIYDRDRTNLMVRIPPQYNLAGLDMFYVDPPLRVRATGAFPPAADQTEPHCGVQWQRFSRHLPLPWRPGIDGLPTLFSHVSRELQRTGK
ncbi:MAG: E2/UBC family protein [Thermoanaerobaculia bacterium]